jgi:hypothetical protein
MRELHMQYPPLLHAQSIETIRLPSGHTVVIPKATPTFDRWTGDPIEDTYGGKAVLDYAGEPVFAELAILRALQESGWDGVWVDTYRRRYRVGYWAENDKVALPREQEALLERIYEGAGASRGCWDVFCWKEGQRLFAEAKRQDRDRIRDTQRRWLEAALNVGLLEESFLIVEWSMG